MSKITSKTSEMTWHYAGSGLPQGPFWKTISTPLKTG